MNDKWFYKGLDDAFKMTLILICIVLFVAILNIIKDAI